MTVIYNHKLMCIWLIESIVLGFLLRYLVVLKRTVNVSSGELLEFT